MARTSRITKVCTRTGFTVTGTPDRVAEHFYRDKSSKDGFSPWCKDAERAYNKAYRDALKAAEAPRKADASAKGVSTFDATMEGAGVRTSRGSSKAKVARTPRKARKDATRTRKAKTATQARKVQRRNKKVAAA